MKAPTRVLLGFAIGYLVLCLGVATGATLPGDHGIRGFKPSFAFNAQAEGSIEATYDCHAKAVVVTAHDTQGFFRRTVHGYLIFKQGGNSLSTPWSFNTRDPSPDQVIATVAAGSSTGLWSVSLKEDPSISTTVVIPPAGTACPSGSPSSGSSTRLAPGQQSGGSSSGTQPGGTQPNASPSPAQPRPSSSLGANGLG
jgi:hypothetical protein